MRSKNQGGEYEFSEFTLFGRLKCFFTEELHFSRAHETWMIPKKVFRKKKSFIPSRRLSSAPEKKLYEKNIHREDP